MDEKMKKASEEIQKLLEANDLALQPFLSFSEFGVVPRVRLVDTNEESNKSNDKETDTTEAGGGEGEPESTDSK